VKLLNPSRPKVLPHIYPRATPSEVVELSIAGRRVAYDSNDMSLHLLDDGDTVPVGSTAEIQAAPVFHARPFGLVLCVSDACNLRCDYCYVWSEAHLSEHGAPKIMSPEVVVRAIDLLGRPNAERPIDVSFFGGEPLTAWRTIVFAVERFERLASVTGAKFRFHVTTNGTLLDRAKAEFLAKHNFGLIVSVDGTREHHDLHRKTIKGVGSYDHVLRGLEHLRQVGIGAHVTLRGTFIPGEADSTPEALAAMNALCDDGMSGSVAYEPAALADMDCSGNPGDYADDEMDRFMNAGTSWCIERARAGKSVRWSYIQKTLSRLNGRTPAFTECGAGSGYMSVSPDGEIHTCHMRCAAIGHVRWGLDEVARLPWLEHRLTAHDGCGACWARRSCGGGCRAYNLKRNGDIHKPGRLYCLLSQAKARAAMRVLVELRDEPEALRIMLGGKPTCAC